jgi:hypothetical protein
VELLEVSDWIVDYDPHTLARRPVDRARLLDRLRTQGEREAARIVASLPERDGALDPDAVDPLLLRVHCELQRLWEEFEHGARLRGALKPLIEVCRAARPRWDIGLLLLVSLAAMGSLRVWLQRFPPAW